MPKLQFQRWYTKQMGWIFAVLITMNSLLTYYNWLLGIWIGIVIAIFAIVSFTVERKFRTEIEQYLTRLGLRIKRTVEEAIVHLPYGILLYDENDIIEWNNLYVAHAIGQEGMVGKKVVNIFPQFNHETETMELYFNGRVIQANILPAERVIYFTDITDLRSLRRQYDQERIAVGIIVMDNLEESTQGLDDQQCSALLAQINGQITSWAFKHGVLMKRLSSDRHVIIMDVQTLKTLEKTRFVILEEIREIVLANKLPVTLSIGIATGTNRIVELGQLAQSSLDIALGRGGDQVAVRVGQRLSFYGGKTNALEKRTRVRARVIAHALRDFIQQSDTVFIMGHKNADMDSLGSSIGILNACRGLKVEAYVVLEESNPAIERLLHYLKKEQRIWSCFISRHEALQMITEESLVVVCDTHKVSMVEEPRLLQSNRLVVIDHHRRGEEFINDAVLVYLEPYASSTAELVTELLQYIDQQIHLSILEATALLAGIMVDTKYYTLQTGSRTFDAASLLRRQGADPMFIQRMLKEDLDEYIQKADVIRHTQILYGHIALVVTEPGRKFTQLVIAQVADTLLNMTDVLASFVISERTDGLIGISARSLGQMNVQVVMEQLGGGGHLTNAAVQLQGSLFEMEAKLKRILEEINIEVGLFE